jgi:hypothetical protein
MVNIFECLLSSIIIRMSKLLSHFTLKMAVIIPTLNLRKGGNTQENKVTHLRANNTYGATI